VRAKVSQSPVTRQAAHQGLCETFRPHNAPRISQTSGHSRSALGLQLAPRHPSHVPPVRTNRQTLEERGPQPLRLRPRQIRIAPFDAWHEGPADATMLEGCASGLLPCGASFMPCLALRRDERNKVRLARWRHFAALHYGQIGCRAPRSPRTTTDMPAIGEREWHYSRSPLDLIPPGCAP